MFGNSSGGVIREDPDNLSSLAGSLVRDPGGRSSFRHIHAYFRDTGKYKGMVNLQERYMKNVMDAIVGRKVERIGHKIDTLRDAEGAQFCVI